MADDLLIVYCTFPDEDQATTIARTLVNERLAACVNIVPGVRSIYRWKGKLCDDAERLGLIKTTAARFDSLRDRLVALHPYDCPEVIAVPAVAGYGPYLDWVRENATG